MFYRKPIFINILINCFFIKNQNFLKGFTNIFNTKTFFMFLFYIVNNQNNTVILHIFFNVN